MQKMNYRVERIVRRSFGALVAALVAGAMLPACNGLRRLEKSRPEVTLNLPARATVPDAEPAVDTARAANRIITFRRQDGTQIFLTPMEVDTATGQKMISVAIDEVVISASNRRNLVERNGKINVEFVVTVPEAFQHKAWRLQLHPMLLKGPDTLALDPLVYTGDRFRAMQERSYARYDDYRARIVDSADYFEAFGNHRAYDRYMRHVAEGRAEYGAAGERLAGLSPREAITDPKVGWLQPGDYRGRTRQLRRYARSTDRFVARNTQYEAHPGGEYDHLNDYFAPRYRYQAGNPLPGGEIYTRVEGRYPDAGEQQRESYFQQAARSPQRLAEGLERADAAELCREASLRREYTGRSRELVDQTLRELSDSTLELRYAHRQEHIGAVLDRLNPLATAQVRQSVINGRKVAHNQWLDARSGEVFARRVHYPYLPSPRLDTVIHRPDGSVQYHYTELVQADENTSKLYLYLTGSVDETGGRRYVLPKSDTLTYSVASMTTFVDETTRYMQRIITRDAEANARFFFTFPQGKTTLDGELEENRSQIAAVKHLTRALMTDPVYIIDSITLRATSSPEGSWSLNERLARERAEALRRVLVSEFRTLYDSLKVSANYTLDAQGRVVAEKADDGLPDLPNLLRSQWLAEDWAELRRLVVADTVLTRKEELLAVIDSDIAPDSREWRLRLKYPREYERLRKVLYPQMRAVDFRFNLHRRGMQQDTVYTTEVDSNYMRGMELLKKRNYEAALTILRPYEDRNTALAYLSLGYNEAAYRILKSVPDGGSIADVQYMLAVVASRLGNEEQAVQYFLRSVELRQNLKFRGNLDPEISRLIRKYGLFREDFE